MKDDDKPVTRRELRRSVTVSCVVCWFLLSLSSMLGDCLGRRAHADEPSIAYSANRIACALESIQHLLERRAP